MSLNTPATAPYTTTPNAPSRMLKPSDDLRKWVSGLLLQYDNTSFSVGNVIDKEQVMYHDDPAPDINAYKSRLTFALESLIEESNIINDDPSSPPHIARSVASPLPSVTQRRTLSASRVNYGTSTFPTFNGSPDLWSRFKISLRSHFRITGMNMNLIALNNSFVTDEENAIFWAFLEQSFRNSSVERYVHLFIDDGMSLFEHLEKEFEKHGLEKVYDLRRKFNQIKLKSSANPSDYLLELQHIRSQLNLHGQVISDVEFNFRYLEGIPADTYMNALNIISTLDDPDIIKISRVIENTYRLLGSIKNKPMERSIPKTEPRAEFKVEPRKDKAAVREYFCAYHKTNPTHDTANCRKYTGPKQQSSEPKRSVNFINLVPDPKLESSSSPLHISHISPSNISHISLSHNSPLIESPSNIYLHNDSHISFTGTKQNVDVDCPNCPVEQLFSTGCAFSQTYGCELPETHGYVVPQPHATSIAMRGHPNLHKDVSPCKIPHRTLSVISRSLPRTQIGGSIPKLDPGSTPKRPEKVPPQPKQLGQFSGKISGLEDGKMTAKSLNRNRKLESAILGTIFVDQLKSAFNIIQKDPAKDIQLNSMGLSVPTVPLPESKIIIDSGASNHCIDPSLCNLSIRLSNKSTLESTVRVAGGGTIQSCGTADVHLQVTNQNGTPLQLDLGQSLLFNGLSTNLLSLGQLVKMGYEFNLSASDSKLSYHPEQPPVQLQFQSDNMLSIGYSSLIPQLNTVRQTSLKIWHQLLGHVNFGYLRHLLKNPNYGIAFTDKDEDFACETCLTYKSKKKSVNKKTSTRAEKPGIRVHLDLMGKVTPRAHGGICYVLCFTDDFSRYRWAYLLRNKSDAATIIKRFIEDMLSQQQPIQYLRTDNATEFLSEDLRNHFMEKKINLELSAPHTHQQNGVAERSFGILSNIVSCLMGDSDLPEYLWTEAVMQAVEIINICPTFANHMKTPFEVLHGKFPTYNNLHIFGSKCFVHLEKSDRSYKFGAKSWEGRFLRRSPEHSSDTYRIWNPVTKRIDISRNVTFAEDQSNLSTIINQPVQNHIPHIEEIDPLKLNTHPMETRGKLQSKAFNVYAYLATEEFLQSVDQLDDDKEPLFVTAALKEDRINGNNHWRDAILKENSSLEKNQVGELVPTPPGVKRLDTRYVFKIKRDANGNVIKYKARYVVKGYHQREGIDYSLTYSPTALSSSTRMLIAVATDFRWSIFTIDVETAFLNGIMPEEQLIYVKPPTDPFNPLKKHEGMSYKLKKSLYGLKQAPRVWNETLNNALTKLNFNCSSTDLCVYTGIIFNSPIIMVIHVDDIIITGAKKEAITEAIDRIRNIFDLSEVRKLDLFLGITVTTNSTGSTTLSQQHYVDKLLRRFQLTDAHTCPTPATTGGTLDLSFQGESESQLLNDNDKTLYQELVGSLLYISSNTRPDIAHSVMQLCRRISCPTAAHLKAAKRVLQYLKGNSIWPTYHPKSDSDPDIPTITGYADANWAGCKDTCKSTGGHIFFLANGPISWRSKLQSIVAHSSTEAEYISLNQATVEAVTLRNLLADFSMNQIEPTILFEDNTSAKSLAENRINHQRSKHIDVKYHYIRNCITDKLVKIIYVPTEENLADILTKTLPSPAHIKASKLILSNTPYTLKGAQQALISTHQHKGAQQALNYCNSTVPSL
jgi:transposase InsO family protein